MPDLLDQYSQFRSKYIAPVQDVIGVFTAAAAVGAFLFSADAKREAMSVGEKVDEVVTQIQEIGAQINLAANAGLDTAHENLSDLQNAFDACDAGDTLCQLNAVLESKGQEPVGVDIFKAPATKGWSLPSFDLGD